MSKHKSTYGFGFCSTTPYVLNRLFCLAHCGMSTLPCIRPASTPVTVAACTSIGVAEETVSKLIKGGVPAEKVSVLAKELQCEKQAY